MPIDELEVYVSRDGLGRAAIARREDTDPEQIAEAEIGFYGTLNDALILGFDEKGALTTLVWPEIIEANETVKLGDLGYRDRLCVLIEQIVTSAAIDSQDAVDNIWQRALALAAQSAKNDQNAAREARIAELEAQVEDYRRQLALVITRAVAKNRALVKRKPRTTPRPTLKRGATRRVSPRKPRRPPASKHRS